MQAGGAEVGSRAAGRAGAEDGRAHRGPVGHPGQRDLGHRHAAGVGDRLDRVDDVPGARRCRGGRRPPCRGPGPPRGGWRRPGARPAGTCPTASRRRAGSTAAARGPRRSQAGTISHSISRTSRLYCGCRVTGRRVHPPARCTAFGQLPAGEVGQPVVADLARADEPSRDRSVSSSGVPDRTRVPGTGRPRPAPAAAARRPGPGSGAARTARRRWARAPIGKRPLVASTTGR